MKTRVILIPVFFIAAAGLSIALWPERPAPSAAAEPVHERIVNVDPEARAKAIVHANTHWKDPAEVLAASRGLKNAMEGIEMETLADNERLANRGW